MANANGLGMPGYCFGTELSTAVYKTTATSITIASGIATVVCTAHGRAVGDLVTFSGITGTGVTGLNSGVWQVIAVTDANTYTFATAYAGSVGGTIIQEPLIFPAPGTYAIVAGANAVVEYNSDNAYTTPAVMAAATTTPNWRTLCAASASDSFKTDGVSVRIRCNGTSATTYYSQYK